MAYGLLNKPFNSKDCEGKSNGRSRAFLTNLALFKIELSFLLKLKIFVNIESTPTFNGKVKEPTSVMYVLAKSHGQAEQGSCLVAHSCAVRFVYLSASHFCSVKNGTLQFWNGILLYIGLYVAKFVFSLRLVPLPLVTSWRRKSVRR